jgi:23S rRNA-/tRNA-specific pseudouridylate synthase
LAKTPERHQTLVDLFRRRRIQKFYWAILNGTPTPAEGIINIPLTDAKLNGGRFRMTVQPDYKHHSGLMAGKKYGPTKRSTTFPAVTEYTVLKQFCNASLVEIRPITGFKHQIRAHMGLGLTCPVLGDHKFSTIDFDGKPQVVHGDILQRLGIRKAKSRDLPTYLHAKRIIIPDIAPGSDISIESKLPHNFVNMMKDLRLKPF